MTCSLDRFFFLGCAVMFLSYQFFFRQSMFVVQCKYVITNSIFPINFFSLPSLFFFFFIIIDSFVCLSIFCASSIYTTSPYTCWLLFVLWGIFFILASFWVMNELCCVTVLCCSCKYCNFYGKIGTFNFC